MRHLEDITKIQIAEIMLLWARADDDLNSVLCRLYDIRNNHTAEDLIYILDFKKKIDLIFKLKRRKQLPAIALPFLDELNGIAKTWADDRNLIAHGFPHSWKGAAIKSAKKRTVISVPDIAKFRERAQHVANVAALLWVVLIQTEGDAPPALPKRPQ